jgi:hypothetical protein
MGLAQLDHGLIAAYHLDFHSNMRSTRPWSTRGTHVFHTNHAKRVCTVEMKKNPQFDRIAMALSRNETMHAYNETADEGLFFGLREASFALNFPNDIPTYEAISRETGNRLKSYNNNKYDSVGKNVDVLKLLMRLSGSVHFIKSECFQMKKIVDTFHGIGGGVSVLSRERLAF